MTSIVFTKMHGLGNDFMIIDELNHKNNFSADTIARLSNRHFGVGFDQLLLIQTSKNADYFCQIFNADGSEAEFCGNGLRCVALYLKKENVKIETKAGIFSCEVKSNNVIKVEIPSPVILEKSVLINKIPVCRLSLGNPHAIAKIDDVDDASIHQLKSALHDVNIGLMKIINRSHIKLRTIERGVGETFACGSNASAAAAAGIINNWLDHDVTIEYQYGTLQIEWEGEGKPLYMTGPATFVFTGNVLI